MSGWLRGVAAALAMAAAACATSPPPPPPGVQVPAPAPGEVAAALLLLGDPGEARPGRTPVLEVMRREAARWSAEGVPVHAVFLGDLVYPNGVRPPDDPGHAWDTLALHAQFQVVAGLPGAGITLVPGNHDWGQRTGPEGRARLEELHRVVARWAAAGLPARVLPDGGIGPAVEALTAHHTLLYLDTQDWLQSGPEERGAAVRALEEAAARTRPGSLLVLAHHPLRSGSEHGADPPPLSPRLVLSRAGVVAQDLTSSVYGSMAEEIEGALSRNGGALLYAAGHDHNLQLFAGTPAAAWELIVGSGSKRSPLWDEPGMVLGSPYPAFAQVLLLEDGRTHLTLFSGSDHPGVCPGAACVAEAVAAFKVVDARYLAPGPEERP